LKKILFIFFILCASSTYAQNNKRSALEIPENAKRQLIEKSKALKEQYAKRYKIALEKFPKSITLKNGQRAFLHGIDEFDKPIYSVLDNYGATVTARANHLFDGGSLGLNLTGAGLTAGVWEGDYIRGTHEAFNGRVANLEIGDFSVDNDETSHATHVSGTIISNGLNTSARGFAINANVIGYNWTGDYSEMSTEAANGLLVSNHSYGSLPIDSNGDVAYGSYGFGKYDSRSRGLDDLTYLAEYYLPVISAGNSRDDSTAGDYDLLFGNKNSKNSLIVAAVKYVSEYTGPESVEMTTFSSWGPTDDGRIKPDISSRGHGVYSSDSFSDTGYSSKQGTSMAAPGITGVLLLLQEHYYNINTSYLKAASARGLLIHTADECNTNFFGADGPDYKYGWGLVNAKKAAECISNDGVTSLIYEGTLQDGESFQLNLDAIANEDITATLSWTDPAGSVYNSTQEDMLNYRVPVLVNDLDLRVSNTSTTFFPWKLDPESPSNPATTGDNIVDNVEKIEISNSTGSYNFVVNHKGALTNSAQNFTLILTGVDSSSLSVTDQNLNTLSVWPNPALTEINFKFPSSEKATQLMLYDIRGRVVYEDIISKGNGTIRGQIDTSAFARGVYILKINQGTTSIQKKVVLK